MEDRFEVLTFPHLGRVAALAAHWGGREDADDLVQETFLRALRGFDQLREPGLVFAWLCRILRGVIVDRHRGRLRRGAPASVDALEAAHEHLIASDPSPLEALLSRIDGARLREALRAIPEEFAEAVELHDVHGFNYREIADATGAPLGTVKSRIARGRRLVAALVVAAPARRRAG